MYDFTLNETNTTADFLRNFTKRPKNETLEGWKNEPGRDVGLFIPRGYMWYTPVTDVLDDFFLKVDYRLITNGGYALAVILILVGAFTPHAEEEGEKKEGEGEKDEAAKKDD